MLEKTEQERFWEGEFGSEYIDRNQSTELLASNQTFFSKIFSACPSAPRSVLELGANVGMNLKAIKTLLPSAKLSANELNPRAVSSLQSNKDLEVFPGSLTDFSSERRWDLVFTKGVLIHLSPDKLKDAYKVMYHQSARYICIAEYYNPSPVAIPYRGHNDKLFKRDFAGEFLDTYPDVQLLSYGFSYRRDPIFPQDDITWFLMEKK